MKFSEIVNNTELDDRIKEIILSGKVCAAYYPDQDDKDKLYKFRIKVDKDKLYGMSEVSFTRKMPGENADVSFTLFCR